MLGCARRQVNESASRAYAAEIVPADTPAKGESFAGGGEMGAQWCPAALLRFSEIRLRLLEIHDQAWFPEFLRAEVVDALQMVLETTNAYRPIAPRLANAIRRAGTHEVLDLFSGAGGPWPSLIGALDRPGGEMPVEVLLTDKYPSPSAANGNGAGTRAAHLEFCRDSVDATAIPARLAGFRTIFSSFHHFTNAEALGFLRDSAEKRRGVGVFEVASRHVLTMLVICFIPVLAWIATPFRRPFRWSRLLWTYVLPVVPFVLFFDGLVSCLRTYSLSDLRAMTNGLGGRDYHWEIGEEKGGRIPFCVVYLVGYPTAPRAEPAD